MLSHEAIRVPLQPVSDCRHMVSAIDNYDNQANICQIPTRLRGDNMGSETSYDRSSSEGAFIRQPGDLVTC